MIHPDATLGGRGEGKNLRDDDLAAVRDSLQEMFRKDPQRYVIRLSDSGRRESFER